MKNKRKTDQNIMVVVSECLSFRESRRENNDNNALTFLMEYSVTREECMHGI